MHITYFDEAGDDGFPKFSAPIFVLSAVTLHYLRWQEYHRQIYQLRRLIKSQFNFPIRQELHTHDFVLNKKPFAQFHLSDGDRLKIIDLFVQTIACLDVRIVNVAINKTVIKYHDYNVLDKALTYSIQRLENQLEESGDPNHKIMLITDPGRIGRMRMTARKIQKFNFVPSKFGTGPLRLDIRRLIEDCLEKDSSESYFIQIADLISFIVYHYVREKLGIGSFPNRMLNVVDKAKITEWMEQLKPAFNTKACTADPYGVAIYPVK